MTTTLTPYHIERLNPPKDDLYGRLEKAELDLQDGDVLVVASKVIAIDEGRSVSTKDIDKEDLAIKEADAYIPASENLWGFTLAIKHHALIASAGVDASNSGDYYTLLPEDPYASAKKIHGFMIEKYGLEKLGIVVIDSHCIPLRSGVVGISIGFWGIAPYFDYRGKPDLFKRDFQFSRSNHIDAIAAAASGVMGEGDEGTPLCVVRGWPRLSFTEQHPMDTDFLILPEADVFYSLLKVFNKGENK